MIDIDSPSRWIGSPTADVVKVAGVGKVDEPLVTKEGLTLDADTGRAADGTTVAIEPAGSVLDGLSPPRGGSPVGAAGTVSGGGAVAGAQSFLVRPAVPSGSRVASLPRPAAE